MKTLFIPAVTALLLLSLITNAQRTAIWIDTDIHLGRFGRDVDDGLAILQAVRSDKVTVRGISFALNSNHGYRITQKLLQRCGKTIPLFKGASGSKLLGKQTEAVEALAEALRKEKLSILILGPATNVATVLMRYPELQHQIKEIVFCGGRQPGRLLNPAKGRINLPDINFERDPNAFQLIMGTDIPLVLAGYEASSTIYLDRQDIKFLQESSDKTDQWLYHQLRQWQKLWKIALGSPKGFIPFDVVTAAWLTDPDYLLYYKNIPVRTEHLANDWKLHRLIQPEKLFLQASYQYSSARIANYCYGVKPEYKEIMLQSLRGYFPPDTTPVLTVK
ncbi:nucleoside hydrolase [Nibrella viscosa]|uniref:Nucleoside hydrolase n=1 Tax=Nibrella viscosa TaxID=1084524 RepID=A0ABP8KG59_9BACT